MASPPRNASFRAPRSCAITSFSNDGVGHQLHAKLSCMAAARAVPGFYYVDRLMLNAEHATWHTHGLEQLTVAELQAAFGAPIGACYPRANTSQWHPRPGGNNGGGPRCHIDRGRSVSMCWAYEQDPRKSCNANHVYSADNCWEYTSCHDRDILSEWLASQDGACVRQAFYEAHRRPPDFDASHLHVVMHVRRGDAIGRQDERGTSLDYFVDYVRGMRPPPHTRTKLWLVTDETQNVSEVYGRMRDAAPAGVVMGTSPPSSSVNSASVTRDFARMLHADVLVLSSSSLSMVAALLGFGRMTVVAPSSWPNQSAVAHDRTISKAFVAYSHWVSHPSSRGRGRGYGGCRR